MIVKLCHIFIWKGKDCTIRLPMGQAIRSQLDWNFRNHINPPPLCFSILTAELFHNLQGRTPHIPGLWLSAEDSGRAPHPLYCSPFCSNSSYDRWEFPNRPKPLNSKHYVQTALITGYLLELKQINWEMMPCEVFIIKRSKWRHQSGRRTRTLSQKVRKLTTTADQSRHRDWADWTTAGRGEMPIWWPLNFTCSGGFALGCQQIR